MSALISKMAKDNRLRQSTETKWGLGLKSLDDMPTENYHDFMLVSDLSIVSHDHD